MSRRTVCFCDACGKEVPAVTSAQVRFALIDIHHQSGLEELSKYKDYCPTCLGKLRAAVLEAVPAPFREEAKTQ